jgi:hypothetical protein
VALNDTIHGLVQWPSPAPPLAPSEANIQEQAGHEWNLIAGCHNLMKLFSMQTQAALAAPAAT